MKMIRFARAAAVVVLAVSAAACGRRKAAAPSHEPAEVRRETIEVLVESTGVVRPRNRLEIKPPFGGRIEEVMVEEGAAVKTGDILARMSSTERAALLDAARAKDEATLRKWEDAYKPTMLIAPLDGTIIARNREPGQTVTTQDAILIMSDRLVVVAQVDETDIGRVKEGQTALIGLDAHPDTAVRGTVRRIAFDARTINNVTVYEVEVEPDKVPDCMKSGMTASVSFRVTRVEEAVTVPAGAVFVEDGRSLVLTDDGDPRTPPARVRVLTGISARGRTEILAGLDGSETVVREAFRMPERKPETGSPFLPSRKK
ncbi:MAG: HlyD family efflux transporter periplasmic adaptor subunit [Lentisphaerae bacterium]|nr:HlyD family efflux transporter periplasmic adaptor subunit [Lentisphaerota bacterium]